VIEGGEDLRRIWLLFLKELAADFHSSYNASRFPERTRSSSWHVWR
jgi:hypothetical protein